MLQGNFNNYLAELIIKQKGDEVEGIFGYYFKDSYQSFFIRGKYNAKTREVIIKNIPILFYLSNRSNDMECPMNFEGLLMVSQAASTVKGSFYTEEKYKYTCPELRINFVMDANEKNQDSILKNTTAGKKFWKPQQEDFIVSTPTGEQSKTIGGDLTFTNTSEVAAAKDTLSHMKLVEVFGKRKKTYSKEIEVVSDSVRISFYDNGDIDGDSISVFLNNQPVLVRQELSSRALNIYLALDSTKSINEISMFANNLGKYPPNTALMLVSDGVNRHELYLSSSLSQNASVRLKRKKIKN